jgi:tetratricopeptide (TPR) repeat protein
LGDGHYVAGRFEAAVAEYRVVQGERPRSEVWAKLGAAALATGDPGGALRAYEQLGLTEPTRAAEAARGLERAIRLAERDPRPDDVAAASVVALRRIAPDRPLGRLATSGVARTGPEFAGGLVPAAVAGATTGPEVDRVLFRSAENLRAGGACDQAVSMYRTVLRRADADRLRSEAQQGLGACALQLGTDALAADRIEQAERWYSEAAASDSLGAVGLRARIGWGDARLRQGDVLGAALIWQAVLSLPGAPDSLTRLAGERLNSLAAAGPPHGDGDVAR